MNLGPKCRGILQSYYIYLISLNFPYGKIVALLVRKVQSRHGGRRHHGQGLGQRDASLFLHLHQLPHGLLLRVVRLRRVPGGGPNAGVFDAEEILVSEVVLVGVGPEVCTDEVVDALGEGLGQAVGQGGRHDGVVVVTVGFKSGIFFAIEIFLKPQGFFLIEGHKSIKFLRSVCLLK